MGPDTAASGAGAAGPLTIADVPDATDGQHLWTPRGATMTRVKGR